ncbi:MFS transporter [Marinomonas sp. M1K-6]|uniref:MFS transporter n=1 Tax=Marinomonas profundi TaxID=2726122 RepID=A0A847R005_9GAMM|nr:MFS transporter [Marinomonas profundi]NLQ16665.1 MFS transporter [Marinomonas profundi]UDV03758.1 MFS transporter [Marinomonas profundi]
MRTSGVLLFIAYLGFISLGLPDAAHGINWPFVRAEFSVPMGWLGLVIAAGGVGYLMSSFSVGYLINRFGVGWLLVVSSVLVSCGLFGFYFSVSFVIFVLFSVVIGMGSGAIDAGLNAYAAEHFSTRHMNWLHAAFGVGATAGPIIATTVLVSFSQNWRLGYAVLAAILFVMALVFLFSRHLWESDKHAPKKADMSDENLGPVTQLQALKHPVIRFQIAFFFLYSGVEVGVGQWAFTVMTESRGISLASAGTWVAVYWGALAFGRAIFGFLVERFPVDQLLRLCLLGVALGTLLFTFSMTPYTSYLGLALMGFCAAPIFPCMISQTATRVGRRYSVHAIGFQMSAAVTGAMTLPFLSGLIGGEFGLTSLSVSFLVYALVLLGLFQIIVKRAV